MGASQVKCGAICLQSWSLIYMYVLTKIIYKCCTKFQNIASILHYNCMKNRNKKFFKEVKQFLQRTIYWIQLKYITIYVMFLIVIQAAICNGHCIYNAETDYDL